MLKYIILQYIRQKENKLRIYLKRYFNELEPFSLLIVKLESIISIISFILTINIIIFLPFHNISVVKNNFFEISILEFKTTIKLIILIILVLLIGIINKINVNKVNKRSLKLNFLYKVIFGQNYVTSIILLLIITVKIFGISFALLVLILSIIISFLFKNKTINSILLLSMFIMLYNIVNIFNISIKLNLLLGGALLIIACYFYNFLIKRYYPKDNQRSQVIIAKKLMESKVHFVFELPLISIILQYIFLIIPKIIYFNFTYIQLIGYISFIYILLIIILQIKNPILVNLDWYTNFIRYINKKSNVNLLKILEKNNFKLILLITLLLFAEIIYIYNFWIWWIFPLMILLWELDSTFTLYSFKILSVSQKNDLRQHTNKQLPYIFMISICIFLITATHHYDNLSKKESVIFIIIYIFLILLVMVLKKEGIQNFKQKVEEYYNG